MHTLCKMFSNKKVLTINVILIRAILVYSIIQKMGREYNIIILYIVSYNIFTFLFKGKSKFIFL